MDYTVAASSGKKGKSGLRRTSGTTDISEDLVVEVHESTPNVPGSSRKVEEMLENIITRLERIEEKIDENVYPPEFTIKPEFIQQVKKDRVDIKKGKGKMYNSIDNVLRKSKHEFPGCHPSGSYKSM
jgi:hypothetical protein